MKFYQFIDEQDVEFRSSTEKEKLIELSRDNSLKQKNQNLYFESRRILPFCTNKQALPSHLNDFI